MFKITTFLLTCFSLFSTFSSSASNDGELQAFTEFGDYAQILLPLTALGATYYYDDSEGRVQLIKSMATATATVHGVKYAAAKMRPGSPGNTHSFPSGHTQAAFSGAAFLQTRYGAAWGVPAYTVAALVGESRIQSDNHFFDDVLAGAGIAMLSNWYFTYRFEPSDLVMLPRITKDDAGLMLLGRF